MQKVVMLDNRTQHGLTAMLMLMPIFLLCVHMYCTLTVTVQLSPDHPWTWPVQCTQFIHTNLCSRGSQTARNVTRLWRLRHNLKNLIIFLCPFYFGSPPNFKDYFLQVVYFLPNLSKSRFDNFRQHCQAKSGKKFKAKDLIFCILVTSFFI